MRKKALFWVAVVILVAGSSTLILSSCGGSGNGSSGTVGFYLTDDMSAYFTQVTATIDKVTFINTGSGASCDVLTTPTTMNIAELSDVMQLVNVSQCDAVPYNRIHIEFEKSVGLTSGPNWTVPNKTGVCSFISYKDQGANPNTLNCSGTSCSLDVNGAVNVLADQNNKLALDFNLKEFDVVGFGTASPCTVTMKVSPLHAVGMQARCNQGYREGTTGLISGLSTADKTFALTRGGFTFTVLYSGITDTQQPGLDNLLALAQSDGLKARVVSSTIDLSTRTITASKVLVKNEGAISNLDSTNHIFTLTYQNGKTMSVDYSKLGVMGMPVDGTTVDVKLYGFTNGNYLAWLIDVQYPKVMSMITD